MANPVKYSDLIINDGALRDLEKDLDKAIAKYEEFVKLTKGEAAKIEKGLQGVSASTKNQREEILKSNDAAKKLSKAYQQYNAAIADSNKELLRVREATKNANREARLQIKLAQSAEGSYNQLSAQYSLNKLRLNALSKEEREAAEASEGLVTKTRELYERMKELQAETGKNQLNVGNYKSALEGLPGPIDNAVSGIRGMGKALKALLLNPVALAITAVVGALAALGSAFRQSKTGSELLARAQAGLRGSFTVVIGIAEKLAQGLKAAFNDPKQAVLDLWDAIKENIVNRVEAVGLIFGNLGKAIQASLKFDFDEAKKQLGELSKAAIQLGTGLDSGQQKEFTEEIQRQAQAARDQAQAFADLASAKLRARRANQALAKQVENLRTEEELLRQVAGDATLSFAEQEEAAQKSAEAVRQRAELEIQAARNSLEVINREIALRSRFGQQIDDLVDQQVSAYQELAGAERDLLLTQQEIATERRQLVQDRLERDLDILIDGVDNQAKINFDFINNEEKALEARRQKFAETERILQDSFDQQIRIIEEFAGQNVDAQSLITETDAVALNEKIRQLGLSEIIEGRLLEIVRDRKDALNDLSNTEAALAKSAADKAAAEAKAAGAQRETDRKLALERFDQEQELAEAEFALLESTEAEKTRFRLEAERDRLQKILELNEAFQGDLTEVEIATLKKRIELANKELSGLQGEGQEGPKNLFDLLGLDLGDDQRQAINDAVNYSIGQLQNFYAERVKLAEQLVERRRAEVEQAQQLLQVELQKNEQGLASNVERAQAEVQLARRQQNEAQKRQERAVRAQQRLETIQQASSLVTASAKIAAQLGAFAAPAIALMFATFAASRIQASRLAQETFGEGGYIDIKGGRHGSGNDVPFGISQDGRQMVAEGGESMAIFSRSAVGKYGRNLPRLVELANSGRLEKMFDSAGLVQVQAGVSTKKMESLLKKIMDQGGYNRQTLPDGRILEKKGNVTTIYGS